MGSIPNWNGTLEEDDGELLYQGTYQNDMYLLSAKRLQLAAYFGKGVTVSQLSDRGQ